MAEETESQNQGARLPQGFTVHSSGPASEKARDLGWGTNEEERTKTPVHKQNYDGGKDQYGPRNFGDTALNLGSAKPPADRSKSKPGRPKRAA